jgi:hypothetical protein
LNVVAEEREFFFFPSIIVFSSARF